jgi:PPK2 family polyphosphate:nucleotide phosphotransferase
MAYARTIHGEKTVRLSEYPTADDGGLTKESAVEPTAALGAELKDLLDLLFYAGRHSLLVVLQARDTGGKDGTIRHVLNYADVQSCRVVPFKAPTEDELAHDFLWRIHKETPGRGSIAIFNRSHYEDVLVVRLHDLAREAVWRKRYDHINHFERMLTDADTILVKFYLHISKEEQEKRLLDREKEAEKAWKLSVGDWKERELWDDYTAAYEDALAKCGTETAPWHLIPADKKWFRNLAVTQTLVETLRPYRQGWLDRLRDIGVEAKKEIEEYRRTHA